LRPKAAAVKEKTEKIRKKSIPDAVYDVPLHIGVAMAGENAVVGPLAVAAVIDSRLQKSERTEILDALDEIKEYGDRMRLEILMHRWVLYNDCRRLDADMIDLRVQDGQTLPFVNMQLSMDIFSELHKDWKYIQPEFRFRPSVIFMHPSVQPFIESFVPRIKKNMPDVEIKYDITAELYRTAVHVAENKRLDRLQEMCTELEIPLGDGNFEHPQVQQILKKFTKENGEIDMEEAPGFVRKTWKNSEKTKQGQKKKKSRKRKRYVRRKAM